MKLYPRTYRVETKWSYQTSWRYVPEDENLTIVQAEKIHKNNVENWPDMSSRVVETSVEVTYEYKARKLTKTEKLYRDFDLRQMGVFVPEHA